MLPLGSISFALYTFGSIVLTKKIVSFCEAEPMDKSTVDKPIKSQKLKAEADGNNLHVSFQGRKHRMFWLFLSPPSQKFHKLSHLHKSFQQTMIYLEKRKKITLQHFFIESVHNFCCLFVV